MPSKDVPVGTWTVIGTGLKTLVAEAVGVGVKVFIGSAAPAATEGGFSLPSGVPVTFGGLTDLGGGVWVRGTIASAKVRYASA